jgi:hypothetical protein
MILTSRPYSAFSAGAEENRLGIDAVTVNQNETRHCICTTT